MSTSPELLATPVRAMRAGDLPTVAALHRRALGTGFFPRLGERFLRAYHRTFVDGPHAEALVVELDGAVVGFVVGPTAATHHRAWTLRQRGVGLALRGGLALLARPAELRRFLRTRARRYVRVLLRSVRARWQPTSGSGSDGGGDATGAATAVLLHVAVGRDARGHGLGGVLVAAFVASCRAAGAREVRLVTEVDSAATSFYDHLGWQPVGVHVRRDGPDVREYRRDLAA